ncbi:hypothetical protein CW304_19150 [Bacillus sp. UFRGS-B20]|nr:hypothetical protein CW304_19150 [Bacillus sp. UFRGS-B20]
MFYRRYVAAILFVNSNASTILTKSCQTTCLFVSPAIMTTTEFTISCNYTILINICIGVAKAVWTVHEFITTLTTFVLT